MQTYLQADLLKKRGLHLFDAWAANFGETQVALELAPEGKGYQAKTRFAKFFNLPELMNLFRFVSKRYRQMIKLICYQPAETTCIAVSTGFMNISKDFFYPVRVHSKIYSRYVSLVEHFFGFYLS